jgi:hypothetical protein
MDSSTIYGLCMLALGLALLLLATYGAHLLAWWQARRHPRRPPCPLCPDARCLCHPGKCPFLPS